MATLKNISHDTPNFSLLKTRWNFKEGNICAAERLALDGIALNGIALIVSVTLIFDRQHRNTKPVNDDEVGPLAVNRPVREIGVRLSQCSFGTKDLAEAGLRHHTITGVEFA